MIIHGMSDDEYHGIRNSLSSTGARRILESPAKFHYKQGIEESNGAFELGKAVHAKVLGVGAFAVAYPEEMLAKNGAASTTVAKEWAESIRAEGNVPMKADDMKTINAMAESVMANPTAKALFELSGEREVSVFAEVDGAATRCRFDALTDDTKSGRFGIDLKTSAKAVDPDTFARSVIEYGYDTQQEFYRDTFRASEGDEINFVFVAVEKEAPYLTTVLQLDAVYQSMGKAKARRAREIYAECMASDTWPGYPTDVQLVAPPIWAAMQHEEKYG